MMNSFRNWYIRNQDAISWFLIGYLVNSGIEALTRGQYVSALISIGFAYANYVFTKVRM